MTFTAITNTVVILIFFFYHYYHRYSHHLLLPSPLLFFPLLSSPLRFVLFPFSSLLFSPFLFSHFAALKITASKVTLAIRIDSYQNGFDCTEGLKLKSDLEDKLEKLQEPSKCKTKKALPIPEEKKRSKRGGKRVKKMKERYAVTDLQSQQNKMSFSAIDGEYGDSAMGVDKGMVGSKDSGRLRAPQKKESKVGLSKKQKIAVVCTYIHSYIIFSSSK